MTSEQIRTKPFLTERKGGYNKDEVVAFLEEVADEFEAMQSRTDATESSSDPAIIAELEELRERVASHEGLQDALDKAYADIEQLRNDVARAREERDSMSKKLASNTDPTAAIGEEVAMVLRSAKEAANELHARAERETSELRANAERETSELRANAEAARADAERAASQQRADAERQAAEIVAQARREADELMAREMARYEELLGAQSEVTDRLAQAETVLRSARERLSAPAPVNPSTFSSTSDTYGSSESYGSSDSYDQRPAETHAEEQPSQVGTSASDWFSDSSTSSTNEERPSDEVQEFAG